jgi:hypothetical protein
MAKGDPKMRIISYVIVASLVSVPVVASAETPQQKETSVWQAFKDKKSDAFKGMLSPDFVAVYEDGTFGRDHELQSLKNSNLKSFKIANFQHRVIDPEDVLMTYTVDVKGTTGKQDVSGLYRASSVWHRSGKLWRAVYHSEIKAK